jgi:hypothetical protein
VIEVMVRMVMGVRRRRSRTKIEIKVERRK